jgi:predicted lipopolysaccharide heptosyltransferase III
MNDERPDGKDVRLPFSAQRSAFGVVVNNILVIKLRYLGDVLLATPVFRALRDAYPDSAITALVNRGTEDILAHNPDLNDVLTVERRPDGSQWNLVRALRKRRFDCALDLTDGDRSAVFARLSGAPVRIGFNEEHRWRGLLYTTVVGGAAPCHRIERDLEAIRPLGLSPKPWPPRLAVSADEERELDSWLARLGIGPALSGGPWVMLQPGARYWFKAWPAERFAALADALRDRSGCRILVGGSDDDVDVAERIRGLARCEPIVTAGKTTVRRHAALLGRCALFVGNDNGPMHMAAALGVPVVGLFGPSDPAEWGPRGACVEVLYKGLDCRACFHPTCVRGEQSCMKQITVDEVLAAAQRLLARGARREA